MKQCPDYFEKVRRDSVRDWDVWSNPRHGGAVKQLFEQVQSPKHVLSELLQNADDAGARNAEAKLEGSTFVFVHDGEDFDESQFASLCGFANSNKRTVHTIGFRGIGFKSTFSLGQVVSVETPTLSVEYRRDKFTLPTWVSSQASDALTRISVRDVEQHVFQDLESNFAQWAREPYPLLFLRNLRRLTLPQQEIVWIEHETPAPGGSQWYRTRTDSDPVLLFRSSSEAFPTDCLEEIRRTRGLTADDMRDFPPCPVDLVTGASGRLYAVLPTGVELDLRFGVNAPFIQDPSRFEIRAPSTSPTNRWLLERAGTYAAECMIDWLCDTRMPLDQRAMAYTLMPNRVEKRASLEEECEWTISSAFWRRVDGEAYVLTTTGEVVEPTSAVLLPANLAGIWSDDEYARVAGYADKAVVSWEVSSAYRSFLHSQAKVSVVSTGDFVSRLTKVNPTRPETIEQVERLWRALADQILRSEQATSLRIVPRYDSDVLSSAQPLCRVPAKPRSLTESDWGALMSSVPQICPEWLAHIEGLKVASADSEQERLRHSSVASVLQKLELDSATNLSWIVESACEAAVAEKSGGDRWKWLAEIHAALDLKASDELRYVLRNGNLSHVGGDHNNPVFDLEHALEDVIPQDELGGLALSESYDRATILKHEDWVAWLSSSASGLGIWVSPRKVVRRFSFSGSFEKELPYDLGNNVSYHYTSSRHYSYQVYWYVDHAFSPYAGMNDEEFQEFLRWNVRAACRADAKDWQGLVEILGYQTPTNGGSGRRVRFWGDATATWIRQLREAECLPDTSGRYRVPGDLYLRSERTRGLEGVESFVDASYDTPVARDFLLKLGVRDAPQNLDTLVSRLRALSKASDPPREELTRLYARIDQLMPHVAWDETQFRGGREKVLATFREESLVFTEGHGWKRSSEVFSSEGSEDLPDLPLVLRNLAPLSLWGHLGVRSEPSWEDAIAWVNSLPRGAHLCESDRKRLQRCCLKDADALWATGAWLSLSGAWTDHSSLEYSLLPGSFRPQEVVPSLQRVTADFTASRPMGDQFPSLQAAAQEQVSAIGVSSPPKELPAWLSTVASLLARARNTDSTRQLRIRKQAHALLESTWQACEAISSVPYLKGAPILVTDRELLAHWDAEAKRLLITPMHGAAEAAELAQCLSTVFGMTELEKALSFCYERPEEQVLQCLSRLFKFDEESFDSEDSESSAASPSEPDPDTEHEAGDAQEDPARGGGEGAVPRPPRRPTTVRQHKRNLPSGLVEDYAYMNGFQAESANIFAKPSGERIHRVENKEFPWEYHSEGRLVRRLYAVQAQMGSPKIGLSYEQWEMLKKDPTHHALLLLGDDHVPCLIEGEWLVGGIADGSIRLRIAQYRISIGEEGLAK